MTRMGWDAELLGVDSEVRGELLPLLRGKMGHEPARQVLAGVTGDSNGLGHRVARRLTSYTKYSRNSSLSISLAPRLAKCLV